jgi:hypothetical protein
VGAESVKVELSDLWVVNFSYFKISMCSLSIQVEIQPNEQPKNDVLSLDFLFTPELKSHLRILF